MGLFDVLFKTRKKKAPVEPPKPPGERTSPVEGKTPLEIARETERLIEGAKYDDALDLAELGVYHHPRSEVVLSAYRYLKKVTLAPQLAELRQRLEKEPNPIAYARLADTMKDLGDYDKAIELCKKAINLYADGEGAWIILGRIRLDRFKEDFIARDALLAIEYYERALELNRNSYKTLLDLAELYVEISAKRRAVVKCEAILYFAPEDEKAVSLLRKAQAIPEQKREDLEDLVKAHAEKRRKAAQRRGRKPGEPLGPAARLAKDPALLEPKLAMLGHLEGLKAAVAMDLAGNPLARFLAPSAAGGGANGAGESALAEAVKDVFGSAQDCSLRMDIGHFKKGVFEGPSGYLSLVVFDEIQVAILSDPATKLERLEEAVTRLVEDEFYK